MWGRPPAAQASGSRRGHEPEELGDGGFRNVIEYLPVQRPVKPRGRPFFRFFRRPLPVLDGGSRPRAPLPPPTRKSFRASIGSRSARHRPKSTTLNRSASTAISTSSSIREMIPEPAALTGRLTGFDTLALDPAQLFAQYGPILPVMNWRRSNRAPTSRRRGVSGRKWPSAAGPGRADLARRSTAGASCKKS